MRRVVSVWLPTWPTDRLRRTPDAPSPDSPLVVAERQGSRRLVYAVDAAAHALGVRPGMTVALAQALQPKLVLAEAQPEADAAALERLAVWALRYGPLVAADPPDGLVIDVAGAAHLHGGEANLVADIVARLMRSGITAHAALAETGTAAWGLARFGPSGGIVPPGGVATAVADLPIAALRLDPAMVTALSEVGIDTVGELAATPRVSLALRFGPIVTGALDRLFGRAPEFLEPVLAPSIPHAKLTFVEPLAHANGLAIALAKLAASLCADLEAAGMGARRLDLRFRRVDNGMAALRVGAARATRDPAHMTRLFGERLDTIDPGFGIEAAVLAATRVEPLSLRQLETRADDEDADPDLAPLIDRIAGRIGGAQVYRLAPVESEIPERSARRLPALAPPTGRSWEDGPRPHRLFDPPQPVEVLALLPDHPPRFYIWKGRRHQVVQADGPESLFGEWWRSDTEVYHLRDYYKVQDADGARAWLFRTTSPGGFHWFIQGLFA
jgi:protein ImuB